MMMLTFAALIALFFTHSVSSYDLSYNPKLQSCNSITTDIKYGPSSVIRNLTNPEYYDFRKRPNAAHIIDEEGPPSHLPDRAFVTLHVRSVVNIDQIKQTLTTRLVCICIDDERNRSSYIYSVKGGLFTIRVFCLFSIHQRYYYINKI
jgi:hypothetical protein